MTADGRILDPEVAEAVRIRIAMVLGGGYAKTERELSRESRNAIFERDSFTCQLCGGPATQIHHLNQDPELVARSINDPANLQSICDRCHRDLTIATFRPVSPKEAKHAEELRNRIDAARPLRMCDDDENWAQDWRGVAGERRRVLKDVRPEASDR